ncbi:hypothetical protein B0H14DRAFT_2575329 [Mycena olivaceomarginata]|nr:hypothetical protein B0H14DRAFT_2575329 [Mycena olivaceomarginata]
MYGRPDEFDVLRYMLGQRVALMAPHALLEAGQNGGGNTQEGSAAVRRVRGGGESGTGVHGGRAGSTRARGAGVDVDWDGDEGGGGTERVWQRYCQRRRIRVCGGHRTTQARAGAGGGCTERAWQHIGGGCRSGVDVGWDRRRERIQHRGGDGTGTAWRGRACSGRCGGGAVIMRQVRRGSAGVGRACVAP